MNEHLGMNNFDSEFATELDSAEPNRGADRDSMLLKAVLKFPTSGEEGEVRIRNLSAGGLMAEVSAAAVRGEKVEINLRTIGWIRGTIAWISEGRMGIAFDHPIDPKSARNPIGQNNDSIAPYLQKLAKQQVTDKSKLRRI
jgi:PilZ domain